MNVVVNLTSGPLAGTLEDDDLRGEGRWERRVIRGLLDCGFPVGSSLPKWGGDSPNWLGHITDLSDSVYLTIYGGSYPPGELWNRLPRARAYIFQFFSAPDEPIEREFRQVIEYAGRNRVVLTHSYPSDRCWHRLASDLHDRTAWLPMPVPEVVAGDPTENTVLFYSSRNMTYDLRDNNTGALRWVRQALLRDPVLTFEAISARSATDPSLWEHPVFSALFGDLRDRVTVHLSISYAEVQKIYARTRLVVCPSTYGGPPLESARYGIPVLASEHDCSLYSAPSTPGFPELPRVTGCNPIETHLERLLLDTPYARLVGEATRRYALDHFSNVAFGRAMNGILESMG